MRCFGGVGVHMSMASVFKNLSFCICVCDMWLLVFQYGILCFSLVQFQPIFVWFVTISTVLYCCLKATVWLVRILPYYGLVIFMVELSLVGSTCSMLGSKCIQEIFISCDKFFHLYIHPLMSADVKYHTYCGKNIS